MQVLRLPLFYLCVLHSPNIRSWFSKPFTQQPLGQLCLPNSKFAGTFSGLVMIWCLDGLRDSNLILP